MEEAENTPDAKLREQELGYLRSELNQSLKISNEYIHRLIGQIILLWGGSLTLFSVKHGNFMEDVPSLFIITTIFFISVVVMYFFSCRHLERLLAIYRIGAYIAIFYEESPRRLDNENKKEGNIFWELANFEIMEKNKNKSDENHNIILNIKIDKMNKATFWFSFIAIFFIILTFLKNLFLLNFFCNFSKSLENINTSHILMILYISYIAISVYLLSKIYKISFPNAEEWLNLRKEYLKSFLDYAITDTKHYTEKDVEKRFGKDFMTKIDKKRQG